MQIEKRGRSISTRRVSMASGCRGVRQDSFQDRSKASLVVPVLADLLLAAPAHLASVGRVLQEPPQGSSDVVRRLGVARQTEAAVDACVSPLGLIADQYGQTTGHVIEHLVRGAEHRLKIEVGT